MQDINCEFPMPSALSICFLLNTTYKVIYRKTFYPDEILTNVEAILSLMFD